VLAGLRSRRVAGPGVNVTDAELANGLAGPPRSPVTEATPVADLNDYDPDFVICGKREIWDRMLGEIAEHGRPQLRHTLSSLALVGEELWLESTDQLREDKFYRFNQTLQELLNLASKVPA